MKKIRIAGVDPSLSNTGIAIGDYDIETADWTIDTVRLIETKKSQNKQLRRNSDDVRRVQELMRGMHEEIKDCAAVFAEVPGGAQSSRAMFSNAICIAMLGSIGTTGNSMTGSFFQVQPSEVKMLACGSKHAAKEEMIEWAHEKFPDLDWFMYRGKLQAKNEHIADAIAAINAGVQLDEFRNLTQIIKNIS
jgi:Holliday junction resolvasome RuvABC endonuclease subunit